MSKMVDMEASYLNCSVEWVKLNVMRRRKTRETNEKYEREKAKQVMRASIITRPTDRKSGTDGDSYRKSYKEDDSCKKKGTRRSQKIGKRRLSAFRRELKKADLTRILVDLECLTLEEKQMGQR